MEDFFQNKHSKKLIEFNSRLKSTGQNLLHLMLQYSPTVPPKFMLKRKDLTPETLNATDENGDSPLLRCAKRNSRHSVYRVFVSKNVKGKCRTFMNLGALVVLFSTFIKYLHYRQT